MHSHSTGRVRIRQTSGLDNSPSPAVSPRRRGRGFLVKHSRWCLCSVHGPTLSSCMPEVASSSVRISTNPKRPEPQCSSSNQARITQEPASALEYPMPIQGSLLAACRDSPEQAKLASARETSLSYTKWPVLCKGLVKVAFGLCSRKPKLSCSSTNSPVGSS